MNRYPPSLLAEDRKDAGFAVADVTQPPQRRHVLVENGEIHLGILAHVLGAGRLWQRQQPQLEAVADA